MAEEKKDAPAAAEAAADAPEKKQDVEMKDAGEDKPEDSVVPPPPSAPDADAEPSAQDAAASAASTAPTATAAPPAAPTPADKKSRRKSGSAAAGPTKKLNRKASKVKILTEGKAGDYFFVKLKGYPTWPVVVCDEDMLPQQLLKTRPVSAAAPDGSYRADFADGGKKVADRSYPVMYLHTNEFGWVCNQDFRPLDPETLMSAVNDKMRKDLQQAYMLAKDQHPLDHYKEVLQAFEEEKEEIAAAKAVAKVASAAKKAKKSKAASPEDVDEDVSMPDATEDEDKAPKSRKRKAEDDGQTPRSQPAKKPMIKLTMSSKAANGTSSAKATAKSSATPSKSAKAKGSKKDKKEKKEEEPELSPEDKLIRKEREVFLLRHKLQRGLLTRDVEPKHDEMKAMSEYLAKLEGFPDLEASIIKSTKINKVLKAILKLDSIPREDEFKFKPRSQEMLDKWTAMAEAPAAVSAPAVAPANGVNKEESKGKGAKTNGVKKDEEDDGKKEDEEETKKEDAEAKTAKPGTSKEETEAEKEDSKNEDGGPEAEKEDSKNEDGEPEAKEEAEAKKDGAEKEDVEAIKEVIKETEPEEVVADKKEAHIAAEA